MDHHSGYISGEEYLENQRRLEANVAWGDGESSGAAKAGTALLSGLLRCGRCGRKLQVVYSGNGGRVPRYGCRGDRGDRGSGSCSSFFGVEQGDRATAWVDHFDFEIANFDADDARAKLRKLNLKYDSSNSKESFKFFDPDGFQVQLNGPDYVGHVS